MAFTTAQLEALDEAIAMGATEVQYKDKKVTYRTLAQMMQLRDYMARTLGLKTSSAARIYPTLSKGMISNE